MLLPKSSLLVGAGALGLQLVQAQQTIQPVLTPPDCLTACFQRANCGLATPPQACMTACPSVSSEQAQGIFLAFCSRDATDPASTVSASGTTSRGSSLTSASPFSEPTVPPSETLPSASATTSSGTSSSDHPSQATNQQSSNPMDQNQTQYPSSSGAESSGLSNTDKIAIGVGVGAGVPIVALILALTFFFARRRRNTDRGPYGAIQHEKGDFEPTDDTMVSKAPLMPHQTSVHNPSSGNVEVSKPQPPTPSSVQQQPPVIERGPYDDAAEEALPSAAATTSRSPLATRVNTAVSPTALSPTMTPKRQSWSTIPLPPAPGTSRSNEPPSPVSPVSPMESRSSSFRRP